MNIVFFNGKFIEEKNAKIAATSAGALFGDGVFTTMLVDDGQPLYFDEHLMRLKNDANFIGLGLPEIDIEDIKKLISLNSSKEGRFRLRITLFSKEKAELKFCNVKNSFQKRNYIKPCDLLINLIPISINEDKSFKLCIYPEIISSPLSKVKTLNYLTRFMLKKYALERGFDDVLVLGPENKIVEASLSNIFWIEGQTVFLPDDSLPYFRGTTLDLVLNELSSYGYKICEGFFELEDISENASVYLCNSLKKFACVSQIDKKTFNISKMRI